MKKQLCPTWAFLAIFGVSGFLNGLAGTGGGTVTVFFLPYFLRPGEEKDAYAYTVLAVTLYSVASLIWDIIGNPNTGNGITADFTMAIPAAVGGAVGALLFKKVNKTILKKLFCVLTVYAGVQFLCG